MSWEPKIGDPTFMGWFTVFAYFAAAALCLAASRAVRSRIPKRELGRQAQVWTAVTLLLVALGVNKQLDLQSWLTEFGRALAREQGWMPERRTVQFEFMLAITVAAVAALAFAAWRVRARRREYWLLLAGVAFTVTFVVLRAASFHHFDLLIGTYVGGVKMNWALELGGIALIGAAAILRRRSARRRPPVAA